MRALLIAEKANLMKDIQKAYQTMALPLEIDFAHAQGHLLELKEPDEYKEEWGGVWRADVLPMIPDRFQYKLIPDTKKIFYSIKEKIENNHYDFLINACDAGREGELIFFNLYRYLKTKIPVKRYWNAENTDKGIKKALQNLIDDKERRLICLKASAQCRAYFDWLIGMNLSRAMTLQTKGKTIPVGRVMTPTLAIIVRRELEIMNFKPENYWEIKGDFGSYTGLWYDPKKKDSKIADSKLAQQKIQQLNHQEFVIDSIENQKKIIKAPGLHSLLELQKEANETYGYSAAKTLDLAQSLYDQKKLLSYPRTESCCLPTSMKSLIVEHLTPLSIFPEFKKLLNQVLSDKAHIAEIMNDPDYVNDQKITDHYAIIPTDEVPNLKTLTEEELNIYLLVAKRLLSIFLPPQIINTTVILTKRDSDYFRTFGKMIAQKGFKVLYKSRDKDDIIPLVHQGDKVILKKTELLAKQSTPPKRYTDASLLVAMKNPSRFIEKKELRNVLESGIGTSSTRAKIFQKIIEKKMVEVKAGKYYATKFGIEIIQSLEGKDIISPEMTARWEQKLRAIENEEYDFKHFYQEMLDYVRKETDRYLHLTVKITDERTVVGKCPICGKSVVEGKSYYLCSDYKNPCSFIINKIYYGSKITKRDITNLLKGNRLIKRKLTFPKSGKSGVFDLRLEDGKLTRAFYNDNESSNPSLQSKKISIPRTPLSKEPIGKCPKCGKPVYEKMDFYCCEGYPSNCNFNMRKIVKSGFVDLPNMTLLLQGEETAPITFVWSNGKSGEAKLQYNKDGKLKFNFCS